MTTNDVTGPLKLLQMMPLDKAGMFQVLKMVNKFGIPKPLPDEDLKRGFDKWWWPDLEDQLAQIKVPEHQPEKSSRSRDDILNEILTLVRTIDKATNRTIPDVSVWRATLPRLSEEQFRQHLLHLHQYLTQAVIPSVEELAQERTKQMKRRLVSEVAKTDGALARALEGGDETYDDHTLILTLKQVLSHSQVMVIEEIADHLGLKLKLLSQRPPPAT